MRLWIEIKLLYIYRSILTVKRTLLIFNLKFILSSTQHVSAFASHHQV
jgi:hypothetical protein